ncbi:nuclear transport factor 2 family protein [Pedobacter sp.]|uniref:nuclear transport factor 2 family protein n=1 Tax=Pedobacter sp. TaxID=1411316 RepID=UPI003BA8948B
MKKILIYLSFFMMSIQLSSAQQNDIENAVNTLTKLMITPDSAALDKLVLDKLSYGHSSGKIQNKREFMHSLLSAESDFVEINLSDQTVTVQGKTALVRHTLSAKTNDKNVPGTVKLYILLIWSKEKGGWKLLGRQAVKVPVV